MRLLSTIVACMLVAACGGANGPTVIDGSSQAAYEESLKQARRDVGPGDRIKLAAAITEFQTQMFAKADNRSEYQRLVREGMDGLTAPAIVAQFNKDVKRVNGQAADAIFDAKRALKGL